MSKISYKIRIITYGILGSLIPLLILVGGQFAYFLLSPIALFIGAKLMGSGPMIFDARGIIILIVQMAISGFYWLFWTYLSLKAANDKGNQALVLGAFLFVHIGAIALGLFLAVFLTAGQL